MNKFQINWDLMWELLKKLIPLKYQSALETYTQKVLSKIDNFAKNSLTKNKVIIDKIARYSFLLSILCLCIGWINLVIVLFAIMLCMALLSESIIFYSNVKRSLGKLFKIIFLCFLGLTILSYLSLASNLTDVFTSGTSFQIQWDKFELAMSLITAFILTLFYHLLNIVVISLLFITFNITKKATHIILKNKIMRSLLCVPISYFIEEKIKNILRI